MYRNQYLAITENNPKAFGEQKPVFANNLHIYNQPPLKLTTFKNTEIEITLLGFAINPLEPEASNAEIVQTLLKRVPRLPSFFAKFKFFPAATFFSTRILPTMWFWMMPAIFGRSIMGKSMTN